MQRDCNRRYKKYGCLINHLRVDHPNFVFIEEVYKEFRTAFHAREALERTAVNNIVNKEASLQATRDDHNSYMRRYRSKVRSLSLKLARCNWTNLRRRLPS